MSDSIKIDADLPPIGPSSPLELLLGNLRDWLHVGMALHFQGSNLQFQITSQSVPDVLSAGKLCTHLNLHVADAAAGKGATFGLTLVADKQEW